MDNLSFLGKTMMVLGFFIFFCGALLLLLGKVPHLGRLPGDIMYHRGNFTFYFPLVTCLLLSLVLTLFLNLFFWRR